ncbi:MAG: SDR family oxidoreductase [Candidatus Calescibacterium sp.]|nr:SDR family oxidoreductase [Candidatus Calescibacterium sp.]MCX7734672.1 SDR family oxidoreductase [bacterium]MDW8087797.1 SDR family oxidoreductase [Candidatus Calescibacterium sp.]
MGKLLEGKVAVVTGAGRGIGREEALLLAKYGAKVVVNDPGVSYTGEGQESRVADEVVAEIKKMGGEAVPNYDFVDSFEGAKRIIYTAIEKFGKIDILVNNAGILRDKMIFNMLEEDWDKIMAVHLKGTFNCSHHACVWWRQQAKEGKPVSGRIINTTSDAGLLGNIGQSNYGSAKAAIAAFTIILAEEMAKYNVTVNAIAPIARTRLTTDATPQLAAIFQMVENAPFDALNPKSIAPLVVYLASDKSAGVTGQVFRIAGNIIWLMGGWRSVAMKKKSKKEYWMPEELDDVVRDMLKNAPPKESMTEVMQEVLKEVQG